MQHNKCHLNLSLQLSGATHHHLMTSSSRKHVPILWTSPELKPEGPHMEGSHTWKNLLSRKSRVGQGLKWTIKRMIVCSWKEEVISYVRWIPLPFLGKNFQTDSSEGYHQHELSDFQQKKKCNILFIWYYFPFTIWQLITSFCTKNIAYFMWIYFSELLEWSGIQKMSSNSL